MEIKDKRQDYEFNDSIVRIKDYLNRNGEYKSLYKIPSRSLLTNSNGFYVRCCALFVDIRDSSSLPKFYEKKQLAKIYRSYISEVVAIMQSFDKCKEVNIVGDCVSGIFEYTNRTEKEDAIQPILAAIMINSMLHIWNSKIYKRSDGEISTIKVGIGLAKGEALMIKAGLQGSRLNDVVWMGDVVNQASKLCDQANKGNNEVIVISKDVYNFLDKYEDKTLRDMFWRASDDAYTGNIIHKDTNKYT